MPNHRPRYPDRARAISASGRSIDGFDLPATSGSEDFKELLAGNGPDPHELEDRLPAPRERGRWGRRGQDSYRWK